MICPRCACPSIVLLEERPAPPRLVKRLYACPNCGARTRTSAPAAPPPRYAWLLEVPCPVCSGVGRVTSTRATEAPPFRWRKCVLCGTSWKDVAVMVTVL